MTRFVAVDPPGDYAVGGDVEMVGPFTTKNFTLGFFVDLAIELA